jgi:hypothetical protein
MNRQNLTPATPPSVLTQIAQLPDFSIDDLRALWIELNGSTSPNSNRAFLERRIAYGLQERAFRKANQGLLERNAHRIDKLLATGKVSKTDRDIRPVPGTVITREYRGQMHRVVVGTDGQYEFEGRRYPTLSMIAREITGTRWSGPLFFGLKASAPARKSK